MVHICLNMIVKNESHIIEDTLIKLTNKIKFSYYIISDTGSDDNTIEIIKNFFDKLGVYGKIYNDTWKDFGYNRSLALKYAHGFCDYLLVFDADDTIMGELNIPENLTHSGYYLKFGDPQNNYQRLCLVKSSLNWRYVGVLHEYITCDQQTTEDTIQGDYYVISGRTSSRNKDPKKYIKDARILENGYYQSIEDKTDLHNRYAYYCANSYLDAGDKPNAIKWYHKTLESQGWYEERYNACVKLGDLLESPEKFYWYLESYKHSTKRVEGILKLIIHYCCKNNYEVCWVYYTLIQEYYEKEFLSDSLSTRLFAVVMDYTFYLAYYMIIVCEKTKRYQTGLKMFEIIFEKKALPDRWWIDNLIYNFQFYFTYCEIIFITKLKGYLRFLNESGILPSLQWTNTLRLLNNTFKVFIYTGFSEIPWNYTWSLKNALGGSERAVLNLVKCFPSEYEIIVSGDVLPETIDNITFIDRNTSSIILQNNYFDIIVVSRYVSFFTLYPTFKCNKLILMAHDTHFMNNLIGCNLTSNEIIKNNIDKVYTTVCLTNWHSNKFKSIHPELGDNIRIINNGINPDLFKNKFTKISNSFIYSSGSMRGLRRLIQLWEDILKIFPDAILSICSYENFPKNEDDLQIQEMISQHPEIVHHGKLNQLDLYSLMGNSEYFLYPCCFDETSCITAMEMLMSEVICLYYPRAGLIDTIGDFGIKISEGTEVSSLINIDKEYYRTNGRKYAEECSWKNRSLEWISIFEECRKVFYAKELFAGEMISDYINSLENAFYTNEYLDLLPTDEVIFVYEIFDSRVFENFKKVAYLNTEPLNIDVRMNYILNEIVNKYPGIKIYDYSLSNIKLMELRGITNLNFLEYRFNSIENEFLKSEKKNNKQIYDYGIICSSSVWTTDPYKLQPPRRRSVVFHLINQGFKVNIIKGFSRDRDTELSKCKTILNIHGQHMYEVSMVFEHIRCDRLLHAGYHILSENSVYFENKFPNLELIDYSSFFKIKKKKIVDCFIFYNETKLLEYRLKLLDPIVDYFVLVEANQTFVGKPKPLYYKPKQNSKVIHIIVDLPWNDTGHGITPDQVWDNERFQRNSIEKALLELKLNESDLLILSDIDEIPDPECLINLDVKGIAQLEQDLYYYTLEHKLDHLWYFSKIMEYSFYLNTEFTFNDLRNKTFPTIPRGGWHLSYFGSPDFISNKIKNFSHQEYNTSEFTDISKINKRLSDGQDIYDRSIKITKVPINENTYLPKDYDELL